MQGQMMAIGGLLAIGLITALVPAALVEAADPMDSTNPPAASPTPAAAETTHTYRNPLGVDIADPDVIFHEGVYYLYGTSAPDGFKVWSSPDLVHWQPRGYAFQRADTSWGRDLFWAPCIIRHRGAFYLFYSSRGPVDGDQQSLRICVARAEAPTGPFIDVAAPLLDIGKAVIDPHTFIDSDGQAYLYYALDISENGQSQIWAIQLTPDLTAPIGKPVLCLKPSQAWEGKEWNEAPFVFKHGRTYVMMYSARGFFDPRYAVGYATAPSPLGPWTKAKENPVLARTAHVSGPGHNTVVPSPDGTELFVVYHVHKNLKGGGARELAIDRLTILDEADGSVRLRIDGPTREPRPMPSGTAPTAQAAAPRSQTR